MGIQRDGRGQPDPYISGNNEICRYHGAWYNEEPGVTIKLYVLVLQNGIPYASGTGPQGVVGSTIGDNGTFFCDVAVAADTSLSHRVEIKRNGITQVTNMQAFKSVAKAITFSGPTAGSPTQTTINVSAQWNPNTTESPGVAFLYYKKTTDISYTLHSTYGPYTGGSPQSINATVSGLTAGTSYQFYVLVLRNTVSNGLWASQGTGSLPAQHAASAVVSANTLASTPVVTTEDASSVSHIAAVLNGTIDANSLPGGVDVNFEWNEQTFCRVDYVNATNITDGKVLTVGAITYTFLEDDVATGTFSYSGQPSTGHTVVIDGNAYTFKAEAVATGGKLAYVNATNPTAGKIVTIPSLTVPAVYKFKAEVAATGGKIAYINANNPPVGRTVTIPAGGVNPDGVYTFVSTVIAAGDVKRGADADASMLNLSRAINKSGGVDGTDYKAFDFGAGEAAHPLVVAVHDGGANEITFSISSVGPVGNVNVQSTEPTFTITDPTGGSWVEDDGDVLIGASADDTMLNLSRAINKSGGTEGEGEDYIAFDFGAGPAAHDLVTAGHSGITDEISLTVLQAGAVGNMTITTDEASITPTDPTGGSRVESAADVLIGATEDDTFLNLTRAINNSGGTPGVGEDYLPFNGAANPDVTASHNAGGNVVNLTSVARGTAGNVAISDTSAAITSSGMGGGADLPGGGYQVLIGVNSDDTMLNLTYAVNKSGGVEGINYVAAAAHPNVTADISALANYVVMSVPTNTNPALTFTTDEATFTLSSGSEAAWANETTPQNFSNDGVTPFAAALSGLDTERSYFFRAKAVYTANGGGTLYGVEKQFTTNAEPLAASVEEEHMQTIQFDGQYGVAKTVSFTLRVPAGTSSDLFYTGAAPLQADCLIFKDQAYDSTSDNAPTQVNSYLYTLQLSAAEMAAEVVDVIIHDASGTAFRDAHLQVRTAMRLSELDIDATQGPTDVSAITAIGNGDGNGIFATSTGDGSDINAVLSSMWLRVAFAQTQGAPSGTKIKLDANASAVDDYYNGSIVVTLGGDGAGQGRVIIAYNGGQREATVDSAWSTIPNNTTTYAIGAGARPWNLAPSAELASVPGANAAYGEMVQLMFQRFAFKIEQTASAQTWYDSSGNPIFDRSVSDDGVTQTIDALANV